MYTAILLILFILPFVIAPLKPTYFETPKLILFEIVTVVLFLIKQFRNESSGVKIWKKPQFLLILLFVFVIVRFILTPVPQAIWGNSYRLHGLLLFIILLLWGWLISVVRPYKVPLIVPLNSLVLLSIADMLFGINLNGRFISSLGEPDSFAAIVLFLLPFLLFQPVRKVKIVSLVLAIVLIITSGSRSGVVGLFLEILFYILTKTNLKLIYITVGGLILLGASLILPFLEGGVWENRAQIWQTAFYAGFRSPLIGNGFGLIQQSLASEAVILSNSLRFEVVDSSHNLFLDLWVEGGVVGLALFVWILILVFQRLIKINSKVLIASLLGLLAAVSFNPLSVAVLACFWWIVGLGLNNKYYTTNIDSGV